MKSPAEPTSSRVMLRRSGACAVQLLRDGPRPAAAVGHAHDDGVPAIQGDGDHGILPADKVSPSPMLS